MVYCRVLGIIYKMLLSLKLIFLCLFLGLAGLAKTQDFHDFPQQNRALCEVVKDWTCPNQNVTFFVYTRENPENGEQVWIGKNLKNSNLLETAYNPSFPSKILIHGYNSDMAMTIKLKDAYIFRDDYNVFLVDWRVLAKGPCYPAAVYNSEPAGKCVAELVKKLQEYQRDIHVIGFSLGAHVAGFTGGYLGKNKVSRITGLDPALPGFATRGLDKKLDPQDAEFVDVIHTNAFIQGIVQESGHIDFYANGGSSQPGCWSERNPLACSHHRAIEYFTESINSKVGFWGWPCASYWEHLIGRCAPSKPQTLMGEYIDRTERGTYLLVTNAAEPFAIGRYFVDFFNTNALMRKK